MSGEGGLVGVIGGDCCGVALAVGVGVIMGGSAVGVAVGGLQADMQNQENDEPSHSMPLLHNGALIMVFEIRLQCTDDLCQFCQPLGLQVTRCATRVIHVLDKAAPQNVLLLKKQSPLLVTFCCIGSIVGRCANGIENKHAHQWDLNQEIDGILWHRLLLANRSPCPDPLIHIDAQRGQNRNEQDIDSGQNLGRHVGKKILGEDVQKSNERSPNSARFE